MMSHRGGWTTILGIATLLAAPALSAAADAAGAEIEQSYKSEIQPLLRKYCFDCHSGDLTEADIDLDAFPTLAAARKQPKAWLKIRHMLDSEQMPPEDSPQPTAEEQQRLRNWVRRFLLDEAKSRAGDPGPVILRRLNNDEYNYTIRDLTGVDTLDPTREFPVDGAAGEGFTNAGSAQSMSPALVTKYLDAAKAVAAHAVLTPKGLRFSPHTTERDKTDELMGTIQAFYRRYTADGGGTAVNLHGIKFNTNQGGLLPVEQYFAATLAERKALSEGTKTIEQVAQERSLNAKYLRTLWETLTDDADSSSLWLEGLRQKWRAAAVDGAPALAADIAAAQNAFWKFNSIGQFGREGGPSSWLEAVEILTTRQDLRLPLNGSQDGNNVTVYLSAGDLGDGSAADFVVWERPRLEFKADGANAGHPPVLLRDVRALTQNVRAALAQELPRTADYLAATAELYGQPELKPDEVAKQRSLNADLLRQWAELAGVGRPAPREITGLFTTPMTRVQEYAAINGWGSHATPSVLTNRSDADVQFLTLTIPARGVTVHPSPDQEVYVAWRSPLDGELKLSGRVADSDGSCGNGVAWRVELMSAAGKTEVASGTIDNAGEQPFAPDGAVRVRQGDVISLIIAARDKQHVCDTTHIALTLSEIGGENRKWDLAKDIVDRILESNPLTDSYGHEATWHFGSIATQAPAETDIVAGSALAAWRAALVAGKPAAEIADLAAAAQTALNAADVASLSEPDRQMHQHLRQWHGPLKWSSWATSNNNTSPPADYGLDPARFGHHPDGSKIDPANLCVKAPQIIEVHLPAELAAGAELATSAEIHPASGPEASAQVQLTAGKPQSFAPTPTLPILVRANTAAETRLRQATAAYRNLFPAALCYAKIVPVDEVVTLLPYYREDDHLKRLMLSEAEAAELDRLWDEFFFVAEEPLKLAVAFEQLAEFATQDRPDLVKAFAPMREPINKRAEAFRERQQETEPVHVAAVIEFADRAWRRPLSADERAGLKSLYGQLRQSDISHNEAVQLLIARILTSPQFLYRHEEPGPGAEPAPVSDLELADRLSYFLWSSMPDAELRRTAAAGQLHTNDEMLKQTRRMLADARTRRMAIQFACQWLHLRNFDHNDDKNEALYPEFAALRGDMYEETVRFFEDMFRNNGSVLDMLSGDHTFLNEPLARHYGIDGVQGEQWRRVEGVRDRGRGGLLAMATFLASQSGASRTSPILRGNWVSETLLGERLPRPPANVPQLPDAVPAGLTARQLIERHSSVPECAKCHARIDPLGFAMEHYDAIGRLRPAAVDTKTTLLDGTQIEGIDGLRDYLSGPRRDDVVRQFCRKLLGYALGREVLLSDEPLVTEIQQNLAANDFRFQAAVETIVLSKQFRNIRGREALED